MKTACIILNYNDAERTCAQAERICGYRSLSCVVIVDNASTDGSLEQLRRISGIVEIGAYSGNGEQSGGDTSDTLDNLKKHGGCECVCGIQAADTSDEVNRCGGGSGRIPGACENTKPAETANISNISRALSCPVYLLTSHENRGYGAGNNLGARFAIEQLGMTHVVIANPDTCFSDACVRALEEIFERHPEVGAASAQMHDSQNGLQQTAWPLRSWAGELANSGPVARRLFRSCINYPASRFAGHKAVRVDVLHGSMLMLSAAAFRASGGYDERIFLYCEENILGQRLKAAGFASVLLLTQQYEHENSGSISRTYKSMLPKQKLRQKSEYDYYVRYLHIGLFRRLVTKLFHKVVLAEVWTAERLGLFGKIV